MRFLLLFALAAFIAGPAVAQTSRAPASPGPVVQRTTLIVSDIEKSIDF